MNTKYPTSSDTTRPMRDIVNGLPIVCWCGQDLEYVQRTHCPRCGTALSRRFASMTLTLAA